MTANLQLTVKQEAEQAGVSERMVYMARRLLRAGRPDLVAACERGEMKLSAALALVDGPRTPDHYAALCRAWNRCSTDEQARFLVVIRAFAGDETA